MSYKIFILLLQISYTVGLDGAGGAWSLVGRRADGRFVGQVLGNGGGVAPAHLEVGFRRKAVGSELDGLETTTHGATLLRAEIRWKRAGLPGRNNATILLRLGTR